MTLKKLGNKINPYLANEVLQLYKNGRFENRKQLANFLITHDKVKHPLKIFRYKFRRFNLLLESLSHTSFIHEVQSFSLQSNEKLEFLGDAVLETLISSIIVTRFPHLSEGELSRFRGALVNETSLAILARFLGLGNCLLLGKGEIKSKGMNKDAILADAFEAFLGGMFLDSDFERTKMAFENLLEEYKLKNKDDFISLSRLYDFDAKTKLQEKTMALYKLLPVYKSEQLKDMNFRVSLYIKDVLIDTIVDKSKKKAERELAKIALKNNLYKLKGESKC